MCIISSSYVLRSLSGITRRIPREHPSYLPMCGSRPERRMPPHAFPVRLQFGNWSLSELLKHTAGVDLMSMTCLGVFTDITLLIASRRWSQTSDQCVSVSRWAMGKTYFNVCMHCICIPRGGALTLALLWRNYRKGLTSSDVVGTLLGKLQGLFALEKDVSSVHAWVYGRRSYPWLRSHSAHLGAHVVSKCTDMKRATCCIHTICVAYRWVKRTNGSSTLRGRRNEGWGREGGREGIDKYALLVETIRWSPLQVIECLFFDQKLGSCHEHVEFLEEVEQKASQRVESFGPLQTFD